MTDPLYVCVHVPEFPAQALLRLRPQLEGNSVVVLEGDPPLEKVCSFNAKAARAGVRRDMTRTELDSFSSLSVLKRSLPEEKAAQSILLETAASFTPRVEVQASAVLDAVLVLDMTGTSRLFGSPVQTVKKLQAAFNSLKFFVQLSASANYYASVLVAAIARKAPVVLAPGAERDYLHRLPIATLPMTEKQSERLSMWGLTTLGDLANLPEVELVVRLGQEGRRLQMLARGELPHLMIPREPEFSLDEVLILESPMDSLDSLLFVLGPMLDQLLARAQNRSYALASVCVVLGLEGGGNHQRTIKPALPLASREILLKLLHLDLLTHPPPAGVVCISIHAEPGDKKKVQLGLFSPQLPESMNLDVTLARIAALVGEGRVGRARLVDTHRPDSFLIEPFTVPDSAREKIAHSHSIVLRRCRPPVDLKVELQESTIRSLFMTGKRYRVQEAFGPWRKSGEWWSADVWSREEWDVRARSETDETLLCVLTHDLLNKRWQMDALYD